MARRGTQGQGGARARGRGLLRRGGRHPWLASDTRAARGRQGSPRDLLGRLD
jgi:hypothetical protein